MYAKKNSGKKILAMALAVVLLIGVGVGGTLAWLTAQSGTVTNTFTVGDVNIDLKEHDLVNGALTNTEVTEEKTYKILPGTTQPKDPFVRVKAKSENSWIFVQIQEVNNATTNTLAPKYVEWKIGEGWKQLGTTSADGVSTYYRTTNYETADEDITYKVLATDSEKGPNGYVTYNEKLTKADIAALDKDTENTTGYGTIEEDEMPQLIFKAFAVQAEAAGTATGDAGANAAWATIDNTAKLPKP